MQKTNLILILIVSFAFAFRIFSINIIPFGFTPDEASFGYDAYSILKTGKDQWGKTLPLTLESFGDYKLPLYTYLTIPSVAVFGLNKFAVRLPNAIVGTLAVLATYLLVQELFFSSKNKSRFSKESISPLTDGYLQPGLVAAFFLTISSWHIMMSRAAFEANLTTFFLAFGSFLFLKGTQNNKYLNWSALILGLNLFAYHSARLVTPLVVLVLIIIYRKDLFHYVGEKTSNRLKLLIPGVIFAIFLLMAFYTLLIGGARRAKDITIFSGALNLASEERFIAVFEGESQKIARIFHNKYGKMSERFASNYLSYFSPNFLFISGPAESTYGMIPGRGVLYWFEIFFLITFLYKLATVADKRPYLFILFWILIAPIPAALTTGPGYAGNRAEVILPALTIASSVGFVWLYYLLRGTVIKYHFSAKILNILIVCMFLTAFSSFMEEYLVISPYKNSKAMLYGNLEISEWLGQNAKDKSHIIISKSLSEPHIYIAFANQWDPTDYQNSTKDWGRYKLENLSFLDQLGTYSLGKYTFTSIDFKKYQNEKDVLLVGKENEFPDGTKALMRFLNPDGTVALMIVEPFSQAYAYSN